MDPYIGRFFSENWVKENVLRFNEDEIERMQKEMDEEEQLRQQKEEELGAEQGDQQDSADSSAQGQQAGGSSNDDAVKNINNQVKQLASGD